VLGTTDHFSALGILPNHGFLSVKEKLFEKAGAGYPLTQLTWLSKNYACHLGLPRTILPTTGKHSCSLMLNSSSLSQKNTKKEIPYRKFRYIDVNFFALSFQFLTWIRYFFFQDEIGINKL